MREAIKRNLIGKSSMMVGLERKCELQEVVRKIVQWFKSDGSDHIR